jgi:hypothetical protein
MSNPEVLYHYTTGTIFQKILEQRAILPDKTEPENEHETPTVTFSSNPVWENSRYRVGRTGDGKLIMMGKNLLKQFDGGLIRIVVPKTVAPLDWHTMKETCGMSKQAIKGIYDFAIEVGSQTSQWFATTESVPEEVWISVEKLNDQNEWLELTDAEPDGDSAIHAAEMVSE